MQEVEFLKSRLKSIAENFSNIHIKYGYDSIIESHIVEILPLHEFETNVELDKAWIPLSMEFMETYPEAEIAFISSDSSLVIENILFEYNVPSQCTHELISEFFDPFTEYALCYTFPTNIPAGHIMKNSVGGFLNYPLQNLEDTEDIENTYSTAA